MCLSYLWLTLKQAVIHRMRRIAAILVPGKCLAIAFLASGLLGAKDKNGWKKESLLKNQ
jgi:hypothetical protein